jgi:4-hydroxythreonine-4-phosphate dehydrogenase
MGNGVIDFIFMLTRNDRTVDNAIACLRTALAAGIGHIGFKNIGLPPQELGELAAQIRRSQAKLYLEIVSLDAESEAASARAALQWQVDVLMGGTRPEIVLPLIRGSKIRYFPFVGRIEGHPSRLCGSADDIVRAAEALNATDGVDGLDLLAYRSAGDGGDLIRQVCAGVGKPVIVAGSIDRPERLAALARQGAAAFTVGTAALDLVFPAPASLAGQLAYVAQLSRLRP